MAETIKKEIDGINCEDGGFNSGFLWKLKKKLTPGHSEVPTAMLNSDGKLVTTPEDIKDAAVYYTKIFENKPMNDDVKHLESQREELCQERLKEYHSI